MRSEVVVLRVVGLLIVVAVVVALVVAPLAYIVGHRVASSSVQAVSSTISSSSPDRFYQGLWSFCIHIGPLDKCKDALAQARSEQWDQHPIVGWDDVK